MGSIDLVGDEIALALPSWCMVSCWKDTWRSSFNFDLRCICLARRARQREVEALKSRDESQTREYARVRVWVGY
jgi:hypothetical protein